MFYDLEILYGQNFSSDICAAIAAHIHNTVILSHRYLCSGGAFMCNFSQRIPYCTPHKGANKNQYLFLSA